jgi:hypothetical protein
MAKKILLVSLMVLLGSTGAWAGLITTIGDLPPGTYNVIDFESQALTTKAMGSSLAITSGSNTVTFTAMDGQLRIDNAYSGSYNTMGNYLDNGPYTGIGLNSDGTWYSTGPGFNTLKIAFNSPIQAFGFTVGALDNLWQLSAYDTGGALIDTQTFPLNPKDYWDASTYLNYNTQEFYGFEQTTSNISYVILTNTQVMLPIAHNQNSNYGAQQGVDWIFIDNFQSSAQVPIPGTVLLLGSGLVALTGLRKKLFE